MKSPLITLLCTLFYCGIIKAQDTLLLNIPEKKTGIKLQYKNNRPLQPESSTLEVDSSSWIFHVMSVHDDYRIVLANTENNDSLRLPSTTASYPVADDRLTTQNFQLRQRLGLKIYDSKNNLLKTYTFSYRQKQAETTAGETLPGNTGTQQLKVGATVHDALFLADPRNADAKKLMILSYYANQAKSREEIIKNFQGNKFVDSLVKAVSSKATGQAGGFLSSAFSSIGGLDVTGVTDALARFLVKRTKQELNEVFFRRLKKSLDSLRDLQTLFPQTAFLFQAMGEEVYNYERYIQNLREAFKEDINQLPGNFPGIIDNHEAFFYRRQDLKAALLSACYVTTQLENQAHPGDILAGYPLEYLDSSNQFYRRSFRTFKGTIQILQLVSASMKDSSNAEDANYWVNIKDVRRLVTNRSAFKIYLGLLRQEAANKFDSIPLELTDNFVQELNKLADVYDHVASTYHAYRNYILRFAEKADALNKMIKNYKSIRDSSALEKYEKYFTASVDMIEYTTAVSQLPILNRLPALQNIHRFLQPYFKIAYSTADLVIDIHSKNYSSAINHAVEIYQQVRARPEKNGLEGTVNTSAAGLVETKKDSTNSETTLQQLIKFGSFMSAVATANNSEEVYQTIEAFSLPPGSSRVKRETYFNIALNGYVGLFTGYEKIKGVDDNFKLNTFGVTAPLGISVSRGHSILFMKTNTNTSSSVFLSFVDIGAVTAFRFSNDEAEKVPSIKLRDIVSPGIFYSFGFGKTPFSLNVGYQLGPLLRKVRLDENLYEKKYSRVSLSFCVDIPVFNFYTRTDQ